MLSMVESPIVILTGWSSGMLTLNDVLIYYCKLLCHSKTTNVYKYAQCLFISGSRTMLTRRLAKVVITTRIVTALAPKYHVSLTFDNLT